MEWIGYFCKMDWLRKIEAWYGFWGWLQANVVWKTQILIYDSLSNLSRSLQVSKGLVLCSWNSRQTFSPALRFLHKNSNMLSMQMERVSLGSQTAVFIFQENSIEKKMRLPSTSSGAVPLFPPPLGSWKNCSTRQSVTIIQGRATNRPGISLLYWFWLELDGRQMSWIRSVMQPKVSQRHTEQ